jgi:peptidoglycan hydrolase-like protein with peptidoglycan-binding domain/uncharacterized protein YraI
MDGLAGTHNWVVYESWAALDKRDRAQTSHQRWGWDKLVGAAAFLAALSLVSQAWAAPVSVNTPPGYALNVRWGPGTQYGVYRRLWRGAVVDTSGRSQNGWVQLIDGTWVAGSFLQSAGQVGGGSGSDRLFAVVATPPGFALNARWGPGETYGIYRRLAPGATLELTGRSQNGWMQLIDGTWVAGNLIRQTAAPPTVPPRPNPNPSVPSQPDNPAPVSDPAVVRAQEQLKLLGYLPFNFVVNGILDEPTREALRTFQRINGLVPDGILGPATVQALNASAQAAGNTTPRPTVDPQIAEVQSHLRILGYLPPNFVITGINDNQTREAIRTFQRVSGITADGVAGPQTVAALNQAVRDLTATRPPEPTQSPNPSPGPTPGPTQSPEPTQSPDPSPGPTTSPGVGKQMKVVTDGDDTLIFGGPGPEYALLRTVPNGTIVTTTGRTSGNWSELNDEGWIFSMWLQPIP